MALERPETVFAAKMPERLMALRARSRAVAAFISTRPPAASMWPLCMISAVSLGMPVEGTATCRKLSPDGSMVIYPPAPNPTRPRGTEMVPPLSIVPLTSAA